ncbi:MAG: AMP-binding protein, partial [Salinisphaeraceae bacterium]|nr:AMP-binding protein [Salinisphaeraceae bacterium]
MATTVIELLENAVADFASLPAMKTKVNGQWESFDWTEYGRRVHLAGRAFMALGVQPGDGVAIIGYNRPPWLIAMMGAIYARAVPAGIYTTCSPEQCHYIAEHCDATVAVVENDEHLQQFLEIRDRLPKLKAIIMMYGSHSDSMVYSWEDFLTLHTQTPEEDLRERMAAASPEDVAELVYTSGTTGNPKGVMITHRNITWSARSFMDQFEPTFRAAFDGQLPQEAKTGFDLISYLPLCHVAEQAVTVFAPLILGGTVWFAESLEDLGDNLADVRPHMFLGVPRVWEKIQARMLAVGASASPLQK